MMTRKNFEAIAKIIKDLKAEQSENNQNGIRGSAYDRGFEDALNTLASNLTDVFAEDNPQFDAGKFLKAAGAL